VLLLRVRHADPAEPKTRVRDGQPIAGASEKRPAMKADSPVPADELAEASIRGEAFDRLKVRYGEARKLASPGADSLNLDWILGAAASSGQRPEELNLKMMTLLCLWLEDLAVQLERQMEEAPSGPMSEAAAAAHRACESVAANLRQATTEFMASRTAS